MRRAHFAFSALLFLVGCIDTRLPDLTRELGEGRTDGPYCAPDTLATFPPEELRIHIIDVGQGDAIWVQTPYYDSRELESRNVLLDAGPSGNLPGASPGGDVVVNYLLTNGLIPGEILHGLVITHAHEDHYGGVERVASTFEIARYVDSGFDANSSGFLAARGAAAGDATRVGGDVFTPAIPELVPRVFTATDLFGEYVDATLLWSSETPPSGNSASPSGTDINNTSVVLALRWGNRQALLMADLEQDIEDALIAANDSGEISLKSNVLKVAHHGSSSSTSRAFLARVFPSASSQDWALISSGRKTFNGVTLPTADTLLNLAEILLPNHILSTENRDDIKTSGTEHGDDTILVRISADGLVEACYVP